MTTAQDEEKRKKGEGEADVEAQARQNMDNGKGIEKRAGRRVAWGVGEREG
ncbi:hypothetical protein [Escherichia coli]|uniref:hypothetical protein n=1 Tax=Escherichia coli TaxID=562 RepID=UPI0013B056CC|nr:hypothetical protein [Escherichia coli]